MCLINLIRAFDWCMNCHVWITLDLKNVIYNVCFGNLIWSKFYEIGLFLVKRVNIGKGPVRALLTLFQVQAIKEDLSKNLEPCQFDVGFRKNTLRRQFEKTNFLAQAKIRGASLYFH